MHESKKAADVEVEEILKPAQRPTDETSPGPEDHVKSKSENTEEKVKKPAEDVFDFKVDEETAEPPKTIERPKQTAAPTTSAAVEVEKSSQDAPVVPAKVGTARDSTQLKTLATQAQAIQNVQVFQPAQTSPVSAPVPSPSSAVGRESALVLQRLSAEEKSSPSPPMPLASAKNLRNQGPAAQLVVSLANRKKSPWTRFRRLTWFWSKRPRCRRRIKAKPRCSINLCHCPQPSEPQRVEPFLPGPRCRTCSYIPRLGKWLGASLHPIEWPLHWSQALLKIKHNTLQTWE